MSLMSPASRPQMTRATLIAIVGSQGITIDPAMISLVGVRGYYRDTMGKRGENDRGIYDDAIFLIGPGLFVSYNANTDPSYAWRQGLATLKPGLWHYKLGIHGLNRPASQRYQALVQAQKVTVARDGQADETGFFGINIHRGSNNSTSSLGCQTIPPAQWPAFIAGVKDQLTRAGQKVIPYALIVNGG